MSQDTNSSGSGTDFSLCSLTLLVFPALNLAAQNLFQTFRLGRVRQAMILIDLIPITHLRTGKAH